MITTLRWLIAAFTASLIAAVTLIFVGIWTGDGRWWLTGVVALGFAWLAGTVAGTLADDKGRR